MNAGNMPPQGGAGGKSMKRAEADLIVYGKGGTFSGDIDGDGIVDGLPSGQRVYWVDPSQPQSLVISARAFFHSARKHKRRAIAGICTILVLGPMAWMAILSMGSSSPRFLTDAEAGGMTNAWAFNGISAARNFVSPVVDKKIDDTVAHNTNASQNVAFSPREERANRR